MASSSGVYIPIVGALAEDGDGSAVTVTATGADDAASLADRFRLTDSMADMRALPVALVRAIGTVHLRGYFAAADGGGGWWVWNNTSEATDNGCTTVALDGVSTGRLERLCVGPLDARCAGAKADTPTHDSIEAINRAIATGCPVSIPRGDWYGSVPLLVTTTGQHIYGAGATATRIISTSTTADILQIGNGTDLVTDVKVERLTLWSSVVKTAGAAIRGQRVGRLDLDAVCAGSVNDNTVDGPRLYDGVVLAVVGNSSITDCQFCGGSGNGITAYTGAELVLDGTTNVSRWGGHGLRMAGGIGGVKLVSGDISLCGGDAIHTDTVLGGGANGELFVGPGFSLDACTGRGLMVTSSSINDLTMVGVWNSNHLIGVEIQFPQIDGAKYSIDGCEIKGCFGDAIVVGASNIKIVGNTIHWNGRGAGGGHGIFLTAGALDGSVVSNNIVSSNGHSVEDVSNHDRGSGIVCQSLVPVTETARFFTIIGNQVSNNAGWGVEINEYCYDFVIANNVIFYNYWGQIGNAAGMSATKIVANNVEISN